MGQKFKLKVLGEEFCSRFLTNINMYGISEGIVPRRFLLLKYQYIAIFSNHSVDSYRLVCRECKVDLNAIAASP